MRAVFDLDDTICVHKNRDYPNAKPITPVIDKMRQMKKDGWEIVIYTARGQISCNKDLAMIEHRNRDVVEDWLKRHDVPCDELIFGKPIGDMYIDDKAISLDDFLDASFCVLHGGSGKLVYRLGNVVKKEFGTAQETAEYKSWIETNNGVFCFPNVISFVYNTVYMEYIDGERGCDIDAVFVPELVGKIFWCRDNSPQGFDITKHVERLFANRTGNEKADSLLDRIARYLLLSKNRLKREGSFCHGDLTLSNIIVNPDGGLFFIDARNTEGANSYLLDLAKLRMSLRGYEYIFGISKTDNSEWVSILDRTASREGILKDVIALEIMFIFRCYRYKGKEDQEKLIRFALREAEQW